VYDKIKILKIDFGLNLSLKFNLVPNEISFLKLKDTTGIIANKHINDKIVI
jgi:hypothetical protein